MLQKVLEKALILLFLHLFFFVVLGKVSTLQASMSESLEALLHSCYNLWIFIFINIVLQVLVKKKKKIAKVNFNISSKKNFKHFNWCIVLVGLGISAPLPWTRGYWRDNWGRWGILWCTIKDKICHSLWLNLFVNQNRFFYSTCLFVIIFVVKIFFNDL